MQDKMHFNPAPRLDLVELQNKNLNLGTAKTLKLYALQESEFQMETNVAKIQSFGT